MVKCREQMTGKDAVNKDKWILFKMTPTLSIAQSRFLIGYLKKSIKSHWTAES